MAALSSLLEKGRPNSSSDSTDVSSSSTSAEAAASTAGESDDRKLPKARQLSPDSTAGCIDLGPHGQLMTEQSLVDEPAAEVSIPADRRITSKCDAQALVGTVHRRLREAEQQRTAVPSFSTVLPANSTQPIVSAMPDCDQALRELAAEACQIPTSGSDREVLMEQVTQSVVAAHLKTSTYTRDVVSAGFQRYLQVCSSSTSSRTYWLMWHKLSSF